MTRSGAVEQKTFYITTPIYYPSDRLHIGHTYTTVAADTIARYRRLTGYDTFYLTGTDEHGQKIQEAAEERGVTPKEFVDEIVAWIKELWGELHVDYDAFIRTTDPHHEKTVQLLFQQLYNQGDIYLGKYEGWYCTPCETFWTESKLEEGKCPDCGRDVSWVEEDAYFLRLSKYADELLAYIQAHPEFIQPESRRNEMIRFIEFGLEDLAVSRRREALQWGIPVPFDDDHVIYVWFDAVTNYISAIGYKTNPSQFNRYWPADVHLVGKEIVRFHTIIWPIMLLAAGIELPRRVFGHGWLTLGGEKISKSRGNVVNPRALIRKYGIDPVRYYLLREIPFGADGSYTERSLIERTNVDLANDLGNLLHRTLSMVDRFADGIVPNPVASEDDQVLSKLAAEVVENVEAHIDELALSNALTEIWRVVNRANKYIDETAPWDLNKQGKDERLATVLYNVLEALRLVAVTLTPFLVEAPEKIWQQLGIEADIRAVDERALQWGRLEAGTATAKGTPIFPRIDLDAFDAAQAAGASQTTTGEAVGEDQSAEGEVEDVSETISFNEFKEVDLRVARIEHAERIEGSDKLLRIEVSLGDEDRQVVAGIARHYNPEDLVGRNAIIVANLEPARIFGVESQGMLLAAVDGDNLALLAPSSDIEAGSPVQ